MKNFLINKFLNIIVLIIAAVVLSTAGLNRLRGSGAVDGKIDAPATVRRLLAGNGLNEIT